MLVVLKRMLTFSVSSRAELIFQKVDRYQMVLYRYRDLEISDKNIDPSITSIDGLVAGKGTSKKSPDNGNLNRSFEHGSCPSS
jgi:hypothetical protein